MSSGYDNTVCNTENVMTIFVIIESDGEYDDYWEKPIGYCLTEEDAKRVREKVLAKHIEEQKLEEFRLDVHYKAQEEFVKTVGPYPKYSVLPPEFDQSRSRDKEYVKEHTKRKHEWQKNVAEYSVTVGADYFQRMNNYIAKCVEEAYDPVKIAEIEIREYRLHKFEIVELEQLE